MSEALTDGGVNENDVRVAAVGAMPDVAEIAKFNFVAGFLQAFTESGIGEAFVGLESTTGQIPLALVALNPFDAAVGLELFDLGFAYEEVSGRETSLEIIG